MKPLAALLQIYGTTEDPYDGCEDAILRTAKKGVLITHELVEEFLAQLYVGRVCMKGWFKAKTRVFLRAAQEMVDINGTHPLVSKPRARHSGSPFHVALLR